MKVDRSADMSVETFNTMFMKYHPLVCKVVIKFISSSALDATPKFSSKDDIVNYCYVEMRRLGTFSRFDAERAGGEDDASWMTYVGEQTLAILRHAWQDHCRLNTRFSVPVDTCGMNEDSKGEQSAALNASNWDPNLDWSMGADCPEHAAECNSVFNLLEREAEIAGMSDVQSLIKAMRSVPELTCSPTANAVAAVLNISSVQALRALKKLRALATDLRLA